MNVLTQNQTHSMQQSTTNVSTLDSQATAQNDNSIRMLSISSLVVSELNVRKSKASKEDNQSLQASIFEHGLIQNLVALPIDQDGLYPIVVGEQQRLKLFCYAGLIAM